MLPSTLAIHVLAGVALAGAASLAPGSGEREALVTALLEGRDDAGPAGVGKVAAYADREAALTLVEAYDRMASLWMKREVLAALARFDAVEDAYGPALERIAEVATTTEERELARAAVLALGDAPRHGKEFLASIVESNALDEVRALALEEHRALSTDADHAWYRALWQRPAAASEEPGAGEPLAALRVAAFDAVAAGLEDRELLAAAEEDESPAVRRRALRELAARGHERSLPLARDALGRTEPEAVASRVDAARILVAASGESEAAALIELGRDSATPELLRRELATLLAGMGSEDVERRLARLVGRGRPHERAFLLRAARRLDEERVTDAVRSALEARDLELRLAAIEIAAERGDLESVPILREIVDRSDDSREVAVALAALERLAAGDAEWEATLLGYLGGERRDLRNAALELLGRRGADGDGELLAEALGHADWSTRLAALRALEDLRRPEALAPIIERLPAEEGRMAAEFADALWRLTGQPYGQRAEVWAAWWKDAGATFELPSAAEVAGLEELAERRRLQRITGTEAEFFGLRLVSQRVVFMMDVSGSMLEPLESVEGMERPVRLEVAKREIAWAIEGLPEGALFNIVLFNSGTDAWVENVAASEDRTRAEALEYVDRLGAVGGTNLHDALRLAFDDEDMDTVVVLSDGEPSAGAVTDPHLIREEVRQWNAHRGVTLHTISLGERLQILEWLSEDSGGSHVSFR